MQKNICSGCSQNYANMESYDSHRVGAFGKDRRCLTIEELEKKGWIKSYPELIFYDDGKPFKQRFPTWAKPLTERDKQRLGELTERKRR